MIARRPVSMAACLLFLASAASLAGFAQVQDSTASRPSFSGTWNTTYGEMRLQQEGRRVTGTYDYGSGARIEGRVEGRRLAFEYREPAAHGQGWFELSDDGNAFSGEWAEAGAPSDRHNPWSGKRVTARSGQGLRGSQIWLVVLEAYWESGLEEQEYSYGEMLREFFRRVPKVHVRHRFFHDVEDFKRICAELRFLSGPIVVYVSSHGTADGLSAAGGTIGPEDVADALRGRGDIGLLHFGSCSVMSGDVPARVFKSLGAKASFPISGYLNAADWAGSAVIDFLYLSLVLERGMPPVEAVEQVRKSISFAPETCSRPTVVPPAGLTIVTPEPRSAESSPVSGSESRPR